jgi:hypothetical protein
MVDAADSVLKAIAALKDGRRPVQDVLLPPSPSDLLHITMAAPDRSLYDSPARQSCHSTTS